MDLFDWMDEVKGEDRLGKIGATPLDKDSAEHPSLEEFGILFLSGAIDPGSAQVLCEKIVEINLHRQVDQIQLLINSPGGDWHAGFAIIDMMDWSQVPVYTTGLGLVASMGLAIFMAGHQGHRVLTPHTAVLSHCFSASGSGTRPELLARRKQEDWMHSRLVAHYLRHTSLKTEQEIADCLLCEVDTWLTPEEAVALGVADRVQPSRPILSPTQRS